MPSAVMQSTQKYNKYNKYIKCDIAQAPTCKPSLMPHSCHTQAALGHTPKLGIDGY